MPDDIGKLTFFADWNYKVEPNEDATAFGNQQTAAAAELHSLYPPVPVSQPGGGAVCRPI